MCGRFTLTADLDTLIERFDATTSIEEYNPRFNIAPSQQIVAVINTDGKNQLEYQKWGLIPFWAKDAKIGYKMINARAETIAEKPSYKNSLKSKRCLIPASSFYEWRKEEGGTKTPLSIGLKEKKIFAFAGLWDRWKSPDGEQINSCTIITCKPNSLMEPIHNRMPVILTPDSEQIWSDPEISDLEFLKNLLVPYDSKEMKAHQVSAIVNSPKNESPECILPLDS